MNINQLLIHYGYTEVEMVKILNTYPINGLTIDTLYQNIVRNYNYLLEKGYSKQGINKMTVNFPSIYGFSEDNLEIKRSYLLEKGYSKQEINKMTVKFPPIYGLSEDNLETKRNYLLGKGYSEKEINKMTVNLPQIYGLNEDNLDGKIWYFNLQGMGELIFNQPLNLMQSVELTYARSCFLVSSGYTLEQSTFKYLFLNAKRFEQKFGITKEEVRELYPYEEYEENLILGGYIQKPKQKKKVK